MKKLWLICLMGFLSLPMAAQVIGYTNNGTSTDVLWYNGAWINAAQYTAPTNMTITNIMARITAVIGSYKCAVYSGTATSPSTLLRGSYEVVNPPTNGWYRFPFTNSLPLTNGQNYWLAIWSSSSSAKIYYSSGESQVKWGQYNYGNWPTTLITESGMTFQNYCMYATNVLATQTNVPPSASANVTVQWDPSPDSSVIGYRFYFGGAIRTYTNVTDVGESETITITNLIRGTKYHFAATAYNGAGVESVFSDELVYTIPVGQRPSQVLEFRFFNHP